MGYHQVPADIIEDGDALVAWARQSVAVALASRAKQAVKPRKQRASRSKRAKRSTR
jgi:hypothetical protein